jgi:hypothetical protein
MPGRLIRERERERESQMKKDRVWSFDSTCLNEIRLARYNYEIDAHDALCHCQNPLEKGIFGCFMNSFESRFTVRKSHESWLSHYVYWCKYQIIKATFLHFINILSYFNATRNKYVTCCITLKLLIHDFKVWVSSFQSNKLNGININHMA